MASVIFAYAFLRAAYADGVRNPVDAVIPIVKRALLKSRSKIVDQVSVQSQIKSSLGIEIPLNVIRYTFPALARDNVLVLEDRIYKLAGSPKSDNQIEMLEDDSRNRIARIYKILNRVLIDHDVIQRNPEEFLSDWLDISCLSFFGGVNPAFNASLWDREAGRLMYIALRDYDRDGTFSNDLIEIVLGDSLYRAIKAITEYEVDDE